MNGLAPTLTQNPTIPSSTPARATVFAALLLSSIVAAQAQTASVAPVNAPAADGMIQRGSGRNLQQLRLT